MTWANLLSGLIGAVLGGLLSIIAAILTMRQQRSLALQAAAEERRQARLSASHTACEEILNSMLTIKTSIDALAARDLSRVTSSESYVTASNALDRIYIVYNAQIADQDLRLRIDRMVKLVEQWRERDNRLAPMRVKEKRESLIFTYFEYVNQSIRAHLDERPLPPEQPAPDLMSIENGETTSSSQDT